jgi:esterase/lipase superfamily enzyme
MTSANNLVRIASLNGAMMKVDVRLHILIPTLAQIIVGLILWWLLIDMVLAGEAEGVAKAIPGALPILVETAPVALPVLGACYFGKWLLDRASKSPDMFTVWYGTNRKAGIAFEYGGEFSDELRVGKCTVSIPKGHKFGSIKSSSMRRFFQRVLKGGDDALELVHSEEASASNFYASVKAKLERLDADERIVLIYIHGFNVDFSEAAVRAAQIGFDLKVPGITAFFSWPSCGKIGPMEYLHDAESIAASESLIIKFITELCEASGASNVNIIAHSMGNRGLIRALHHIVTDEALPHIRFNQIFLAAPDIDVNLFKMLAKRFVKASTRTTLYVSSGDYALRTSKFININQRAGYTPPVLIVQGIDTVEATNVDVGLLGHGYYAEAAAILYDMATLIRADNKPEQRIGLYNEVNEQGQAYWVARAVRR